MAIEDEIINISDLDAGSDINKGDKLLIETNNGTKLLDFKDFVIGTDNISFFDKISSAFIAIDEAGKPVFSSVPAKFSNVDINNAQILTTSTPNGYVTKYEDIKGVVELSKQNYNDITTLAGVSADVGINTSEIQQLKSDILSIRNDVGLASSTAVSAANFIISAPTRKKGAGSAISFTTKDVDPNATHSGASISLGGNTTGTVITFPSDNFYATNFYMIDINVILKTGSPQHETLEVQKYNSVQSKWVTDTTLKPSRTWRGSSNSDSNAEFNRVVYVKIEQGDKLRFATGMSQPVISKGARITGIRVA